MEDYNEYIKLQQVTVQDTSMETLRNFDDVAVKFHVKVCTICRSLLLNCIISSRRYLMLALPYKIIK
jgi:hypothetical protein